MPYLTLSGTNQHTWIGTPPWDTTPPQKDDRRFAWAFERLRASKGWADEDVAEALGCTVVTMHALGRRYVLSTEPVARPLSSFPWAIDWTATDTMVAYYFGIDPGDLRAVMLAAAEATAP